MSAGVEGDLALARARTRLLATWERWQAARARGEEYQRLAVSGLGPLRAAYADLAQALMHAAATHLSSARLQASYVARLQEQLENPDAAAARAQFMVEVASAADAASAAVYLHASTEVPAVGLASDALASRFQDGELVMLEGPTVDVVTTGDPASVGDEQALSGRWPQLALALGDLGVHGVAAVPIRGGTHPVGALTVVNPRWGVGDPRGLSSLRAVAAWVAETAGNEVLSQVAAPIDVLAGEAPSLSPLLRDDRLGSLHQAAGMVAADVDCGTDAALALIRAHSFAESIDLQVLIDDITAGRCRLAL